MSKDIIEFITNEIKMRTGQEGITIYSNVVEADTPERYIAHICWSKQISELSSNGACIDIRFVDKDNIVLGNELITRVVDEMVTQIMAK